MSVAALLQRISGRGATLAIADGRGAWSYADLSESIAVKRAIIRQLPSAASERGQQTIAVEGDYSLETISALIACAVEGRVSTLVSPDAPDLGMLHDAAVCGWHWRPDVDRAPAETRVSNNQRHPLLEGLAGVGRGGFVVFSSGSSAAPKAVLHDFDRFTCPLMDAAKAKRTLAFLLFDHIAGVDTALYTLFAGGSLIVPASRSVRDATAAIERHRVQVLPTSPAFLKLLALDGNREGRDLSSLEIVTYGSEPVSGATLERLRELLPDVRLIQKYGTSEFGAPRSQTRDGDGLWLRLDPEATGTRIEDGILWVRPKTMMVGYLNAEQPEMRDGWVSTGDRVEVDGDWVRILGRASAMINVGGEKVMPEEVELTIEELSEVAGALVTGEPHAILGQIVTATVHLSTEVSNPKALVRKHCAGRLAAHKVPMKVRVADTPLTTSRHKKRRRSDPAPA